MVSIVGTAPLDRSASLRGVQFDEEKKTSVNVNIAPLSVAESPSFQEEVLQKEDPRKLSCCSRAWSFLKANVLPLTISAVICAAAGALKHLNRTIWNPESLNSGTDQEDYQIETVTTAALTVVARIWIERPPLNQYKKYILTIPVGWIIESYLAWRWYAVFANFTFGPQSASTQIFTALATNIAINRFFPQIKQEKRASRKVSDLARASVILRSLTDLRVSRIENLSCKEFARTHLLRPMQIAKIVGGGIGMSLYAIPQFRSPLFLNLTLFDVGLFFMFHGVGGIAEDLFYTLWLNEERKLKEEEEKHEIAILNSPDQKEESLSTSRQPTKVESPIKSSKKLDVLRLISKTIYTIGPIAYGILLGLKYSPVLSGAIGVTGGMLDSRAKRAFNQHIAQWEPISSTCCERIVSIVGRILGISAFLAPLVIFQIDSPDSFLEHSAILITTICFGAGWFIFKKLESNRTNKLLNFIAFTFYYPDLGTTAYIYTTNHVSQEYLSSTTNHGQKALFIVGYSALGISVFLHRSVAASNLYAGSLLTSPIAPLFASSILSWYLGSGSNLVIQPVSDGSTPT